jgi:hypothetical protein
MSGAVPLDVVNVGVDEWRRSNDGHFLLALAASQSLVDDNELDHFGDDAIKPGREQYRDQVTGRNEQSHATLGRSAREFWV